MMSARVLSVACCVLLARAAPAPASASAPAPASTSAPAPDDDVLKHSTLIHTADHEVTGLGVLLGDKDLDNRIIFFIESDLNERGERVDYGLYALKKDVKTKLLDSAKDIAVVNMEAAYFGARDGIYLYDKEQNAARKYGAVTDDVVSLAVENGTGVLYYLNQQHQLYRVTEGGKRLAVVDAVKNAEEIVVDYTGHLYYYTADKTFYMYDGSGVRKVEGIPNGLKKVSFLRTPMIAGEYALVLGDGHCFDIRGANATASRLGPQFAATAVSADAGLVAYFSRDRSIYEYNVLGMMLENILEGFGNELKKFAQKMQNPINWFNTR